MLTIGSEGITFMPPNWRAATSCGDRGRALRRSFCLRFWNQIWTSFSFNDTRWTISRRACLSGLGLLLYASSRIILSLATVRFLFPLGCFSESGADMLELPVASARGGRLWGVTATSCWLGADAACLSGVAATKELLLGAAMIADGRGG